MRGFDIRGIGPRVVRTPYNLDGTLNDEGNQTSDALGGRAYYMARAEIEIPTSAGIRSLGLRPSAFIDAGSVWKLKKPDLTNIGIVCTPYPGVTGGTLNLTPGALCPGVGAEGQIAGDDYIRTAGVREEFLGNSPSPRLAVGVGVNWVSPFGPFRIDIARALLKQRGDDTKFFSFNVGTQF
jgi:outer membrane protein insertion porin family